MDPIRLLYCDYDGDFPFVSVLSQVGYLIDEIRPEALRQVSVGEHQLYLFCFESDDSMKKAFRTIEKLKVAGLQTPIVLLYRGNSAPEFFHHQQSAHHADSYLANLTSGNELLDCLDSVIGIPVPSSLKGNLQKITEEKLAIEKYKITVTELEARIQTLEEDHSKTDRALEAQRNFYKPKLKALLEEQKVQVQTETEKLKFQLSEVEAKLLDRELKMKDLEEVREKLLERVKDMEKQSKVALEKLREFYQSKLKEKSKAAS